MADMNFGVNLLPTTDLGFSLGSNDKQWKIVGTLNGNASSATKATQDSDGVQINTHYMKSEEVSGNIDEMQAALSGKTGRTGSINLTKKAEGSGSNISGGWYNYIFSPHRSGIGGDNPQYSTTLLFPMNFSGNSYIVRRGSSTTAATEVKTIIDSGNIGSQTVSKANQLSTARTISLTGSVTGSGSFDGSGNLSIATTTNHDHDNRYVYDKASASGNMNTAATWRNAMGMINLSGTDATVNPNGQTGWHHFINMSYPPTSDNMWQTQIANKVGSTDLWVRSRAGGTVTDGTAWVAPWTKILTAANYGNHTHSYLPLSGGIMTGQICLRTSFAKGTAPSSSSWYSAQTGAVLEAGTGTATANRICYFEGNLGTDNSNIVYLRAYESAAGSSNQSYIAISAPNGSTAGRISSNVGIYGAVWNDYAEFRESDITEPGHCIIENGDDTLSLSTERLQRGCEIVSDTFGFAIGETNECKTPIAASGRVLAYPYEDREEFRKHIGWPVCSGPNGTVSIMTEEEEEKYPSRIIGIISAVPDYEEWGTGKVKVNGRVWIRIK